MSLYYKLFRTAAILLSCCRQQSIAMQLLGRKSTASEAFNYLRQNNQLAPYVSEGGTAIVTGGNSGIGGETVKTLVQAGMKVVLCARNVESATALKESLPPMEQDRVSIEHLDLSNLKSVKEAAGSICSKYSSIDCLINNAGIMAIPKRETTSDGIELQFGTNHVGHQYLTRLLLPNMSNQGRVVNVASTAHKMAPEGSDWESNDKYTPWGAYGKSKLANILFTKQLHTKIESVCLHPGVIASPLWKHSLPSILRPLVRLISNKSVEQGAATTVYCALSRHVQGGAYYDDCAVADPSAAAKNQDLQKDLWQYTEDLLATKGFEMPAFVPEEAMSSST